MHVDRESGREGDAPWAMQLVARVERTGPPTRTAVCAAAAVAVVRLLADDRAQPGGEWSARVRQWTDGPIRKHCRRARGAAWDRALALPGVTAEVAGAEVRALVPTPTDAMPREVARLQLTGRELDDPDALGAVDPVPGGPVVVSICPAPLLPLGKAAAAAGHATQLTAGRMAAERLATWAHAGFPVVVEHPAPARWAELRGHAPVQVLDAGFTAVAPGTCTALARWA
ncbi:peptidyl-tRNA hydrolase [Geodermatophilus marinus]|uniref:peptidyl-tRNA hydrolase n=1 Tax=Geodermatophilus sp. LHW52908 TaxID=2303986 RepID=UPI001313F332|nr:peptidyl-tRNA hydrolase [Geodermatophilus sp. LHW52908]